MMLVPTILPRLTLGAVQLGMPYGLGAAAAGLSEDEAQAILTAASEAGISAIDTARAYGRSEERIGRWLAHRRAGRRPLLISKFPKLSDSSAGEQTRRHHAASAAALGTERIDFYLAHRGADLTRPGVHFMLADLAAQGHIGAFGASVYDDEEASGLLAVPGIGALQLPVSVASGDKRPLMELARTRGVRIFARSVFVQGLLLLDPDRLPARFAGAAASLRALRSVAREAGLSLPALLLGAALGEGPDSAVVGADSPVQVAELAAAAKAVPDPAAQAAARRAGAMLPRELADPRFWPKP